MAIPLTAGLAGASLLTTGIGAYLKSVAQDKMDAQLKKAAAEGDDRAASELLFRENLLKKLEDSWQTPEFAAKGFTPEEISYIGDYMPQVVEYVKENNPTLITGLQAEAEKNYQKQALGMMAAETKDKPIDIKDTMQDKVNLAQMQAAAAEQSQRRSLLNELANRGMTGTGQEASILADAQQKQAQGLRESALQAGIVSAREQDNAVQQERARKLAAIQGLMSSSTAMRGQELSLEQQNANIINSFNERASQRYQTYLQNQANIKNEAVLRNLQAKQSIEAQNTQARNAAAHDAINRDDRNRLAVTNAANQKANAMYGAGGDVADVQNKLDIRREKSGIKAAELEGESPIGDILMKTPEIAKDTIGIAKDLEDLNKKGK
jgi:hypothetical protein